MILPGQTKKAARKPPFSNHLQQLTGCPCCWRDGDDHCCRSAEQRRPQQQRHQRHTRRCRSTNLRPSARQPHGREPERFAVQGRPKPLRQRKQPKKQTKPKLPSLRPRSYESFLLSPRIRPVVTNRHTDV